MADHSPMKLGKQPPKKDLRTLQFARYATPALPAPPEFCDWSNLETDWGMMRNDALGDCTIAGCAHAVQTWTLVINQRITIPDNEVVHYYSLWDGYVDGDPNTDQGGVELDVLNQWRQQGLSGHTLTGYAAVNHRNEIEVRQAIALFGGVYIGLSLPISAQSQDVWDTVQTSDGQPGSWGGHCVWVLAYDKDSLTCITWGETKKMTWRFWENYCDESYALLSPDFIASSGLAPSNFDLATLQADLSIITS